MDGVKGRLGDHNNPSINDILVRAAQRQGGQDRPMQPKPTRRDDTMTGVFNPALYTQSSSPRMDAKTNDSMFMLNDTPATHGYNAFTIPHGLPNPRRQQQPSNPYAPSPIHSYGGMRSFQSSNPYVSNQRPQYSMREDAAEQFEEVVRPQNQAWAAEYGRLDYPGPSSTSYGGSYYGSAHNPTVSGSLGGVRPDAEFQGSPYEQGIPSEPPAYEFNRHSFGQVQTGPPDYGSVQPPRKRRQLMPAATLAPTVPAMVTTDGRVFATSSAQGTISRKTRNTSTRKSPSAEVSESSSLDDSRSSSQELSKSAIRTNAQVTRRGYSGKTKKEDQEAKQTMKGGAERIMGYCPEFSGDAAPKATARLPPCHMSAVELLYLFPNHTQWPKLILRLKGNGWSTAEMSAAQLYGRGLATMDSIGRRKAALRHQVIEGGRCQFPHKHKWTTKKYPGDVVPVTVYDVSLYTPRPHQAASRQSIKLIDIGKDVVNWPAQEDSGFVTKAVQLAMQHGNSNWTTADVIPIAQAHGWVLPAGASLTDWDQRGRVRVPATLQAAGIDP